MGVSIKTIEGDTESKIAEGERGAGVGVSVGVGVRVGVEVAVAVEVEVGCGVAVGLGVLVGVDVGSGKSVLHPVKNREARTKNRNIGGACARKTLDLLEHWLALCFI